jgi:glycine/D-amino acid oxidase-like deaminating enzyme
MREGKDVAVIGAGIVGACTALMLQRRGHRPVLIDPNPPGEGSSYGNAGCFNGSSVVPMSMPGIVGKVPGWIFDPLGPLSVRWRYLPRAAPWLWRFVRAGRADRVREQAKALRALLSASLPLITSLAREAGAGHLVHHRGHLYAYRSEEGYRADTAGWALRRDNGVAVEELDAQALRDFDPALSHDLVRAVLVAENGHTSNPGRLVNALVEQVVRNGGTLVRASALGFELDGGRLARVRTSACEVPVTAAVIAAGAFSKPLAAGLGDKLPLDTERGYHLVVREPEASPRVPTTDAEGKFIASPMDEGLRLAGTVEIGGLSLPPDWRRARALLRHARRLLPALRPDHPEERLQAWMGFRPSMPDSLPVIGRSRTSPDVIYAFGHGHVGMTGAPKTGELVAELIGGHAPSIDLTPFRPDRFS